MDASRNENLRGMLMFEYFDSIKKELLNYKTEKDSNSIFVNISGYYYHEYFHSDILAFYLKSNLARKHFINWLNGKRNKRIIKYEEYSNGEITRETDRIDIALFSNDSKRAIIIENKSNGAIDQDKQLYRYFTKLEKEGIEVESIFYLNKNSNKSPDLNGVDDKTIAKIREVLTIGQLVGPMSFTEKVINNVILETNDIRMNAFSQELKDLFSFVVYGETDMDNLDEFERILSNPENYNEFVNAVKMYKDMPIYLANKYKDYLIGKSYPFRFWLYRPQCLVVDDIIYNKKKYALDIWFFEDYIDISILDRHDDYSLVDKMKTEIGKKFPFNEKQDDRYHIYINNPYNSEAVQKEIDKVINSFI
jgi:hypothetical protein